MSSTCNGNCSNVGACVWSTTSNEWYCQCYEAHYASDCSDPPLSVIDPYRWLLVSLFALASFLTLWRIIVIARYLACCSSIKNGSSSKHSKHSKHSHSTHNLHQHPQNNNNNNGSGGGMTGNGNVNRPLRTTTSNGAAPTNAPTSPLGSGHIGNAYMVTHHPLPTTTSGGPLKRQISMHASAAANNNRAIIASNDHQWRSLSWWHVGAGQQIVCMALVYLSIIFGMASICTFNTVPISGTTRILALLQNVLGVLGFSSLIRRVLGTQASFDSSTRRALVVLNIITILLLIIETTVFIMMSIVGTLTPLFTVIYLVNAIFLLTTMCGSWAAISLFKRLQQRTMIGTRAYQSLSTSLFMLRSAIIQILILVITNLAAQSQANTSSFVHAPLTLINNAISIIISMLLIFLMGRVRSGYDNNKNNNNNAALVNGTAASTGGGGVNMPFASPASPNGISISMSHLTDNNNVTPAGNNNWVQAAATATGVTIPYGRHGVTVRVAPAPPKQQPSHRQHHVISSPSSLEGRTLSP
jgi:hypothetical protein